MKTAVSRLLLHQPRTLAEAVRVLRDEGPSTILAGCTDVYVGLAAGAEAYGGRTSFVDVRGLDALRFIRSEGRGLVIGALTTWTDIRRARLVQKRLPMLVEAAKLIGGAQIQNRGTLGGNVANGSPAGDGLPVLLAADAIVVLLSAEGERRVQFAEFYVGYRRTVMRPDEMIVAFEIPPVVGRQWFRKVGTRAAQAISKVVAAGVIGPEPRLAFGSVAPTVLRARKAEAALAAGKPAAVVARLVGAEIAPIDDVRSTAVYRRAVATAIVRRALDGSSANG